MLPIITAFAPAASALLMSPEKRTPPSPMTGTPEPFSASDTLEIAVICGTPTPATIRVVQIEPGPMPTFTPSAPYSTSALAALAVAMLPPITSTCGKFFLTHLTRSSTPLLWPCAVSTTITSPPACTSSETRSSLSAPTPTAAPRSSLPCSSLHGSVETRFQAQVAVRDDTDQLRAFDHRKTRNAMLLRQRDHIAHLHLRRHRDRIAHDARFEALDLRDFARLFGCGQVL